MWKVFRRLVLVVVLLGGLGLAFYGWAISQIYSPRPAEHLFSYTIESVVEFSWSGTPLRSRQVHHCEVVRHRTTFSGGRGVSARWHGSDNHHFLLPDGAALVLFGFRPCAWRDAPPKAGIQYKILPKKRRESRELVDPTIAYSAGEIAWLDDRVEPKHIWVDDLTEFPTRPEVSAFQITARYSFESPVNELVANIPALAVLNEIATTDDSSARSRLQQGQGFVLFGAALGEADKASVYYEPIQHETTWVHRRGSGGRKGGRQPVRISIGDNPGQVEISTGLAAAHTWTGVTHSLLSSRLEVITYGEFKSKAWPVEVCVEDACFPLRISTTARGSSFSAHTLFHPPSGRAVALTIRRDLLVDLANPDTPGADP